MKREGAIRVLVVEDDAAMTLVLEGILQREFSALVEVASSCASAREKLCSCDLDIVTLDHRLPDGKGQDLLRWIGAMDDPPPVVMVTGHGDEQLAVDSFKLGAAGYVVKDDRLSAMFPEAIRKALERVALHEARKEVRRTRDKLEAILDALPDMLFEVDREGRIHDYRSPRYELLYVPPEEFLGKTVEQVLPEQAASTSMNAIREAAREGKNVGAVYSLEMPDGTRWFELSVSPVSTESVPEGRYIALARDITEHKRADRLVEVQRDLALKLLGISGFQETLEVAIDAILEATAYDCGGAYLLEEETGALELEYSTGISERFSRFVSRLEIDSPVTVRAREGKSRFMPLAAIPASLCEEHRQEGIKSFGMVPVIDDGKVIGVVNVSSHTASEVPEESKVIAEVLAGQTGQVIRRARLASALAESEERHRLMNEYAGEAIYTYDRNLVLTGVNRVACEIAGYSAGELIGKHALELGILHPEDVEKTARDIDKLFAGEKVVRDQFRFIRKDGSVILADVVGAALKKDGEVYEVVNIVHDITESKKAEEELGRMNVELKGYARTVSHDLKGPLTGILLALDLMENSLERIRSGDALGVENAEEAVSALRKNAKSAQRRIDDLLALAEAGQVPREVYDVDMGEIVEGVLRERSGEVENRRIKVRVDPGMGHVKANPTQMEQVFSNLVGNAIDHCNDEGLEIEISCLGDVGGGIRYRVRDNGPGIPPDDLENVFTPFFKGEEGGTGLGLAIVRRIIDVYNGEITAANDNGACFEFVVRDLRLPD